VASHGGHDRVAERGAFPLSADQVDAAWHRAQCRRGRITTYDSCGNRPRLEELLEGADGCVFSRSARFWCADLLCLSIGTSVVAIRSLSASPTR
jgi:hypothetical protein